MHTVIVWRRCKGGAWRWGVNDDTTGEAHESPKIYMSRDQAERAALKAYPGARVLRVPPPTREYHMVGFGEAQPLAV